MKRKTTIADKAQKPAGENKADQSVRPPPAKGQPKPTGAVKAPPPDTVKHEEK